MDHYEASEIDEAIDELRAMAWRDWAEMFAAIRADRDRLAAECERLRVERDRLIECWPYAASCVTKPRCVGSRGLPYAVRRIDGAITSWHATREEAVRAAAGLDAEGKS